jgi:hypothetical protein
MDQVIEHLPSKHKARVQTLIPTPKKRKRYAASQIAKEWTFRKQWDVLSLYPSGKD